MKKNWFDNVIDAAETALNNESNESGNATVDQPEETATEKKSGWKKIAKTTAIVIGGLVVGVGGTWLGIRSYRNKKAQKEQEAQQPKEEPKKEEDKKK